MTGGVDGYKRRCRKNMFAAVPEAGVIIAALITICLTVRVKFMAAALANQRCLDDIRVDVELVMALGALHLHGLHVD